MLRVLLLLIVSAVALGASGPVCCSVGDDRFGMSGFRTFADLDNVGAAWFLNWGMSTSPSYANASYPYVRMFWRTTASQYTDEQIQNMASTVRQQVGPGAPVYWIASNEPNDRGQANQTPAEFAPGYYKYHKNLKIGDPECKVLGPSMLNWTFTSDSVWQSGHDWYSEFRTLWAADPAYSAYSQSVQQNPYPPMDAFNLHTYDLRGIQGTPWEGYADWKYLRDQTLACHADLQTWPETAGKKIWNTEYGALRVATITDSADTLGGFGLWLRKQPFMERWFFFILYTGDGSWGQTVLLDSAGNLNALGKAHLALSTMGESDVWNLPHDDSYLSGQAYTREGSQFSTTYSETVTTGMNYYLNPGYSYQPGMMRGRAYSNSRRITRVTFNYRVDLHPAKFQLELDIPGRTSVWTSGSATGDGWADVDLSGENATSVSLGIYCKQLHMETGGNARIQISNVTLWLQDPVITTPAQAKSLPNGQRVRLPNVVVSSVYPDSFAVQTEGRSSGIIALGSGATAGERCTVSGDLITQSGYRALTNVDIRHRQPGPLPAPLAMNTPTSGGSAYGLQAAVVDYARTNTYAIGLSNVGLLIRLAGKVTYVHPAGTYYYLDDGASLFDGTGLKGVQVSLEGHPKPTVGQFVDVTGVCYTRILNGRVARYLRLSP